MTAPTLVPIGELASATGVAVSALRYYDELGVITPAERSGGKRWFNSTAIGRVNFVRRAQRFGFSLSEIRDILDDETGQTREIAAEKVAELRAQQIELGTMIELLEEMLACGCHVVAVCPAMDQC